MCSYSGFGLLFFIIGCLTSAVLVCFLVYSVYNYVTSSKEQIKTLSEDYTCLSKSNGRCYDSLYQLAGRIEALEGNQVSVFKHMAELADKTPTKRKVKK